MMMVRFLFSAFVFLATALVVAQPCALAQATPPISTPEQREQKAAPPSEIDRRAEAYYNFAMGNYFEGLYEDTSQSEYASLAIEHYKKAYALDPHAAVIGERLAGVYAKSQRIRDAVLEAQEILKQDRDNLPARRLLARIYIRTLGDRNSLSGSKEATSRAIEQLREILRLDPTDTESTLWLARLYRFQNEHQKAEEVLRAGLEREPEDEDLLGQLTHLLLDQGRAEEAATLLAPIIGRSPSPDLLSLLGDAYARMQDHVRAEQAYRSAVESEPRESEHRRKLAQSLLDQGKAEAALEQYKKLTELEPSEFQNYLHMGQIYRQLKKLDLAEESILRAKQRAPGSLEVIYSEALLYESQGRFDDAIRVLSDSVTAVKSSPGELTDSRRTLAILYEQLGRLYREVENYTAAVNTYREMLRLDTETEKHARALIADTYRLSKDMPRALEESRKALELYPQDRGLQVTYALLLGENGQTDEAARFLREKFQEAGNDRELFVTLAQVYERGHRYADAEQAIRRAEKLASSPAENEGIWFLLGAILERQKKFDLAEEQFKKVIELNPRNAQTLNYFGYMLADRGVRLDEAVIFIRRALEEEPYNGAYLDSLGWAYFQQNRLSEAESFLRKAADRSRHDPTIREHLGDVLFKTGRLALAGAEWEKALAEWQRALPTELDNERVASLEKKLASLKHRVAQKSSGEPKPK
jgi:tetratricopeptide (TPR) repeat protein